MNFKEEYCEKCLHSEVCYLCRMYSELNDDLLRSSCKHFKDESECVFLPCRIFSKVFTIDKGKVVRTRLLNMKLKQIRYGFNNPDYRENQYFLTEDAAKIGLSEYLGNIEDRRNNHD